MLLFLLLPPGTDGVVVVAGNPSAEDVVVVPLESPDTGASVVVVATGAAGTGGSVRLKKNIGRYEGEWQAHLEVG